jgi:hypothetical protein
MKLLSSFMLCFVFLLVMSGKVVAGPVKGRMLMRDGTTPFANGMALFFDARKGLPPDPHVEERPPEYSAPLDSEGKFDFSLPPGKYYFGAIKRQDSEFGPPLPGDLFFINQHFIITVPIEDKVDLGDITEGGVFE